MLNRLLLFFALLSLSSPLLAQSHTWISGKTATPTVNDIVLDTGALGIRTLYFQAIGCACNASGVAGTCSVTLEHVAGPTAITSVSVANPTVVTTTTAHGMATGDTVIISGTSTTPSTNGPFTATVTGATTFTIPVNVTIGGGAAGQTFRTIRDVLNGTDHVWTEVVFAAMIGGGSKDFPTLTIEIADQDRIRIRNLATFTGNIYCSAQFY